MGLKWVPVDAYHMPELPAELKVDPLVAALLHAACFMELSGEKTVDPDESITAMESVAYYLQRLTPAQAKAVGSQLRRVAAYDKKRRWNKDAIEFVSNLMENLGVEPS